MFQNNLTIEERSIIIKRLIFLFVLLIFSLILANKISYSLIVFFFFIFIFYVFLREYLWIFLIIAIPSLIFGKILNISITANWIYEARIAEILLLLTIIIFILDFLFSKSIKKIRISGIGFLLFIYLILSFISFKRIVDLRYFIFGLKVIVYSFLAYFLALNLIDSKRKIKLFLYILSFTSFILSIQIFFKFYQMGFSSAFFFERSFILLPIAPLATTAAILAFFTPLQLGFYFYLNNKTKVFIFISFFFSFLAVFLSLGKAAILSLLIALFFMFVKLKKKRVAFILFIFMFLSGVYLIFYSFLVGLIERMTYIFVDQNTSFRIKEYISGWQIIQEHFFFGIGIGQQLIYFKKLLNIDTSNFVNNFFLQSFIDLGLIGFSLVLALIYFIYKEAKKSLSLFLKDDKNYFLVLGFISALIVAFLNGLAEVSFYALPYAIIFFITLGVFMNIKLLINKN